MKLINDNWTKIDIENLNELLEGKKIINRQEWTKRIVNTNMDVLAVKSKDIDLIVEEILKGNVCSFLNCYLINDLSFKYYENTIIFAKLLNKVNDFKSFKSLLMYFAESIDNWASCDAIKSKFKWSGQQICDVAKDCICSEKEFVRRVGFRLLFACINDDCIDNIFNLIKKCEKESEYYVNMIIAWLLTECFIKQREKTIAFMRRYKNRFALNKAISKCHDSFRVNEKDKQMLKSLRIN